MKETALAPDTYEYCLVVNGHQVPDPLTKETVPNPVAGSNSILQVASSPEAAHRADATNFPLNDKNQQKT